MGHMNIMHYVGKFDQVTWNLFAASGLTGQYFREHQKEMVVLEKSIIYSKEVLVGDTVFIASRIDSILEKVIKVTHNMFSFPSNEGIAMTTIVGLHIDTIKRNGAKLPPFIDKFRQNDTKG